MSYTPTTWQTGDTITAAALNNMESGIAANDGYWIPVEYSGGAFSVPDNKVVEVSDMLLSQSRVIKGVKITNGTLFSGYRVNNNLFVCQFTSELASEIGIEGTAKLVVRLVSTPGEEDEVSVEIVPDTFVITCTPTAADYSGVMDKTPADIGGAISAGQKIMFDIPSLSASVEATQFVNGGVACANITYAISGQDVLIQIVTSASGATYSTKIFPLTPMS